MAPAERNAQRFVLDCVPTLTDAEAELPAGEDVDLGSLLRDERGRPLSHDQDAGDEPELRRDGREVAEEHERLVERVLCSVDTLEPWMTRTIGAEHVVVRKHVFVAEVLRGLRVGANAGRIGPDLDVGEVNPELNVHLLAGPALFCEEPRLGPAVFVGSAERGVKAHACVPPAIGRAHELLLVAPRNE